MYNNIFDDALAFRKAVEDIASSIVMEKIKNCFQIRKATVVTAPYIDSNLGNVCKVVFAGDTTELVLPYSSKLSNISVNQIVLVAFFGSLRNAIVWETPNFN